MDKIDKYNNFVNKNDIIKLKNNNKTTTTINNSNITDNNSKNKNTNSINSCLLEPFIGKSYSYIGEQLYLSHNNEFKNLLNNRQVPSNGLSTTTIKYILSTISTMDSNNSQSNIGIGEREGRVLSTLVKERHFSMIHGMGRSGNITDLQPKATGSSLIVKLTNALMLNFLHFLNLSFIKDVVVFPLATGMALTITYLTLKKNINPFGKYIIFPRIDQKTCLKAITTAGFTPIVVEPIRYEDQLETNIKEINNILTNLEYYILSKESPDKDDKNYEYKKIKINTIKEILCISTTTSCFAPRNYDNIIDISILCNNLNIPHIINSAYGVYCTKITDELNHSNKKGRIDAIISSTDKNFLTPVGGSIIYSKDKDIIKCISNNYPGRASLTPILDLFITLLETGKNKYKELIKERSLIYKDIFNFVNKTCKEKYNERAFILKRNKISIAISLENIVCNIYKSLFEYYLELEKESSEKNIDILDNEFYIYKDITFLGSMFFNRQISGIKVVASKCNNIHYYKLYKNYIANKKDHNNKQINNNIANYQEPSFFQNIYFYNYSSHTNDNINLPYVVFAIAIGISKEESEYFKIKFFKYLDEFISIKIKQIENIVLQFKNSKNN